MPTSHPALEEGAVHVWRTDVGGSADKLDRCRAVLDPDELARAARFRFDRDRDSYTTGRGTLRRLLAKYLSAPPAELRFATNDYGKPYLTSPSTANLQFNVSHSGKLVLIAVALRRDVGIDVEVEQAGFDWQPIATRIYSEGEQAALRKMPENDQVRGFFQCWALKEAYVKARGQGLSFSLQSFTVPVAICEADGPFTLGDGDGAQPWTVRPLYPRPGYAAALAVEGKEASVQCYGWRP